MASAEIPPEPTWKTAWPYDIKLHQRLALYKRNNRIGKITPAQMLAFYGSPEWWMTDEQFQRASQEHFDYDSGIDDDDE